MTRDELLTLCDLYVRRRGLGVVGATHVVTAPASEIIDSYRHAEISESEKNSLLSYIRDTDEDADGVETDPLPEFDPASVVDFSDDAD
ncbi:MAG: hypothetical protein EBZ74_10340 [Planctomycetia bacterium]|nr:hypothetical protein [Planctomycetia bacterium]